MVRGGRDLDADGVAGVDGAGGDDDGHDADTRLAGAGEKRGLHEAGPEPVELDAGCAETGELEDGRGAEMEAGGERKGEEVQVAGSDVFAELAGDKRGGTGRVAVDGRKELLREEMDLGAIRCGWVAADEVAVPDGGTAVGVAFDAEAGEEMEDGLRELGEGMARVPVEGEDGGWWHGDGCGEGLTSLPLRR